MLFLCGNIAPPECEYCRTVCFRLVEVVGPCILVLINYAYSRGELFTYPLTQRLPRTHIGAPFTVYLFVILVYCEWYPLHFHLSIDCEYQRHLFIRG